MVLKSYAIFCSLVLVLQICSAKVPLAVAKQNSTTQLTSGPARKSNTTVTVKSNVQILPKQPRLALDSAVRLPNPQNVAQQSKRTLNKTPLRPRKNSTIKASQRQINLENFVDNHKGAIVQLLKKLLLPKLKARALQHYHTKEKPIETDPANGNLDKEAMNYELGYFLGLQKAFKNRQMLMGDSGEDNLVPLKLTQSHGSPAAVSNSNSAPMTGYTSVSLPFHKMQSNPVHESLQTLFSRYGMQDPGFLKKVSKADERDILQFAGKHDMDVFAEQNNPKGISEYLSKRAFISRPSKAPATNEGSSQRIKKDDILGPSIFAEEPDKPQPDADQPFAKVDIGPNPLEHLPTPLHKIVSQADHISSDELHDLLKDTNGRVNWGEISGLIGDEEKTKETMKQFEDKTPEVGSVYGEDTNVAPEEGKEVVTPEELQNADQGESEHEVEKRTFNTLLRLAARQQYEENKNELKRVLRRIISRLSDSYEAKRNKLYETPSYLKRGYINGEFPPYYRRPVYSSLYRYPLQRIWRRSGIPRPTYATRRADLQQPYEVSTEATKNSQENDDYDYKMDTRKPVDVEETGGVVAYALPKMNMNPSSSIENYVAIPKEESYKEAVALLNRGSSIDDSLGDHLQAGFLQRFVLPNAPVFKRSSLKGIKTPFNLRMRLRRSNSDSKKKSKKLEKERKGNGSHKKGASSSTSAKSKKGKLNGKKSGRKGDISIVKVGANGEVTSQGSKKHEILRQDSMPYLSDLDHFVAPAVFESRSQNFFTQGAHDSTKLINHLSNTVLVSGPQSGVGTATNRGFRGMNNRAKFHAKQLPPNGKMIEEIISSPRMSSLRTDSFARGQSRSKLIGDRRISPVLDIYQDHSVSSTGDTPVMEVQSIRPGGTVIGKDAMQEAQNFNGEMQNGVENQGVGAQGVESQGVETQGVETQGQGTVEMSSNYEVVKPQSSIGEMEAGNLQSVNEDLVSQQNSQVMDDPKGDEQTGVNAINVEEVSGEAKQAISNTLAALDKQGIAGAKAELENCCQVDSKAACCKPKDDVLNNHQQPFLMGDATFSHSPAGTPVYDVNAEAHPLSDHNLVQTMNKASQGLDEELFAAAGAQHSETKVANHVYLPDEDFDGIDWKKLHQPVHGPSGYNADSKEDIQLLSDPFFAPGVGEPIGDHSKPSVVPQSLLDHPANHFVNSTASSQTVVATPAVTDAKTAPSAVLKADAANTAKALSDAGALKIMPQSKTPQQAPASVNAAIPKAAPNATAASNAAVSTVTAAAAAANAAASGANMKKEQLHAYEKELKDLFKSIVDNSDNGAATLGKLIANSLKATTHEEYINSVKDAAAHKIKENNEHASQLHKLANEASAGNAKIAAEANQLINTAAVMANQEVHVPSSSMAANVTGKMAEHLYSSHDLIHSLQDHHNKAVDDLETEANKLADLHHDSLHMGTYLNQDAVHSMSPASINNILSHGHVDAEMHMPAVYGDWHTAEQDAAHHHDAYTSNWNHVQLDSNPQYVDLTPMTPGGIHFTNAGGGGELTGITGVGLQTTSGVGTASTVGTNMASSITATANAAAAGINGASGAAGAAGGANAANTVGAAGAAGLTDAAGAAGAAGGAGAANAAGAAGAAGLTGATGAAGAAVAAGGADGTAGANSIPAKAAAAAAQINAAAGNSANGAAAPTIAGAPIPAAAAAATNAATASNGGSQNANVVNAAASEAAKAAASAGGDAATVNAAAANAAKAAAGSDLTAVQTEASNIGKVGGEMKLGSNSMKNATTLKTASASKDDIAEKNTSGSYPDIDDSDGDKRNGTISDGSFDDDDNDDSNSKKKTKEEKSEEKDNNDESSGLDASTASTADVEDGGKIEFSKTNEDNFQMEKETHSGDISDGKITMEFNQTNSEGPGPDAGETGKNIEGPETSSEKSGQSNASAIEEPKLNTDDKTTSLEVGSLKETKVGNFTESATAASEEDGGASFVTNTEVKNRSSKGKEATGNEDEAENFKVEDKSNENEKSSDNEKNSKEESKNRENEKKEEENGESRVAGMKHSKKQSNQEKSIKEGEKIESDEALRGNEQTEKLKTSANGKRKQKPVLKRKGELAVKAGSLNNQSKKKPGNAVQSAHMLPTIVNAKTPHEKVNASEFITAKIGGNQKKISSLTGLLTTASNKKSSEKVTNSTEFFIGKNNGNKISQKNSFRKRKEKTQEFFLSKGANTKVNDGKIKRKNSSEFFLIKTNNLTSTEPRSEEELYSKGELKTKILHSQGKENTKDLDDFQLSVSARKHLLPGDLEKLSKLHHLLSVAQITLLKKKEPAQENAMTRMLNSKSAGHQNQHASPEDMVRAEYRNAIYEALQQIDGVKKSLTNQEFEQETGKQPKNDQYRAAIHEALKEVDAVKKSLAQTTTSSRVLANALAISNLANLLRESTSIFNKAYGVMHNSLPSSQAAGNMVTGDPISPGASGSLINPASSFLNKIANQPMTRKSTKDIYAEIGTPSTNEDDSQENSEKKTIHKRIKTGHVVNNNGAFRTIKEI